MNYFNLLATNFISKAKYIKIYQKYIKIPKQNIYHSYCDNLEHLVAADVAVAVQVVHGEGPPQLLLQFSSGGDGERAQELPEVDGAVAVGVEGPEDVLGKLLDRASVKKGLHASEPYTIAEKFVTHSTFYKCTKRESGHFLPANQDFLPANQDFLLANQDFLLANQDFLLANQDFLLANQDFLPVNQDFWLLNMK